MTFNSKVKSVTKQSNPPLSDFTLWCRDELFTPPMIRAASLLQHACNLHLLSLYRSLHFEKRLTRPTTASELAADLRFVESASIALEAMLLRLANRMAIVDADGSQEITHFTAIRDVADPLGQLEEVQQSFGELDDAYRAAIDFVNFGAQYFVYALRDEPDFMDKVLTGRDTRFLGLWFRATNEDPLQDVHGIMGARIVESLLEGGRILEIGGGTGNGTRHLLQSLAVNGGLGRIQSYLFTDVSMPFILRTRQQIKAAYPSVCTEWGLLDINKPFASQKISAESLDLIYGVNSAHVARDIVGFLRECRTTLREGGRLVFAERVRLRPLEMAPRELTLNLSTYHRTAAIRNPEYRPMHAYLSPAGWLRALELAGFSSAILEPNFDALSAVFPDQYASVVVAQK
jgi:SAM-dependent methyltransferase